MSKTTLKLDDARCCCCCTVGSIIEAYDTVIDTLPSALRLRHAFVRTIGGLIHRPHEATYLGVDPLYHCDAR